MNAKYLWLRNFTIKNQQNQLRKLNNVQDFINTVRFVIAENQENQHSIDANLASKEADSRSHVIYQGKKSADHNAAAKAHDIASYAHNVASIYATDNKKKEYHSIMSKQHKTMFKHHLHKSFDSHV